MREQNEVRIKRSHPHAWLWEPLEAEPTFELRTMFGTKAVYLDGRLMFCFATKEEPWRGILIATDRPHHASLISEVPMLIQHPVLPKWLYLSESSDVFESRSEYLIRLARQRDKRIGVVPSAKKRKRA